LQAFFGGVDLADQGGAIRARGLALALLQESSAGGILENFTEVAGLGRRGDDDVAGAADQGRLLADQGDAVQFAERAHGSGAFIGSVAAVGQGQQGQGKQGGGNFHGVFLKRG